uniref:Uncharacterized protein n=1 Tax=Panstrongylus lignarius TaxID=156445 RepID=A0A224XZX8_9HEMI
MLGPCQVTSFIVLLIVLKSIMPSCVTPALIAAIRHLFCSIFVRILLFILWRFSGLVGSGGVVTSFFTCTSLTNERFTI